MINLYLNQTATLKAKASVNLYNEATYTSSTINCRFQHKRKMARNAQGEEVVSMAQVFTTTEVDEDDTITYDGRDWQVIAVEDCVGLDGTVNHYEVFL
jgi:hypothetical protein